jgi:hypothetical protein
MRIIDLCVGSKIICATTCGECGRNPFIRSVAESILNGVTSSGLRCLFDTVTCRSLRVAQISATRPHENVFAAVFQTVFFATSNV